MELDPSTVTQSDLDNYFMKTALWPAIVYTTILMIVGTVGNILVLYVYRRHFQRSVTRMFIYALAVLDLGNCLITMPAELSILIQFTTFPSPVWCKVSRYLTYTFNGTSSIVLITIAMDSQICQTDAHATLGYWRKTKVQNWTNNQKFPIEFSDTGVTILSGTTDLVNSSKFPSPLATSGRPFAERLIQVTLPAVSSTAGTSSRPNGGSSYVVYGRFCLLSSEHITGKLPLLFYVFIFIMYMVMVVLVVFFYGKVARAMFSLTSKHSKMFSFYTHKNCTPSSNSVNPDVSIGQFQVAGSKVNEDEVTSADHQTKQKSSVVVSSTILGKEDNKVRTNSHIKSNNSQTGKEREQRGDKIATGERGPRETGYETGDTTSNSEAKAETPNMGTENKNKEDVSTEVCRHGNSQTRSKTTDLLSNTNTNVDKINMRQKDNDLQNTRSQKAHSSYDIDPKILVKDKRRRTTITKNNNETNKIPKIKIQKADREKYDSDQEISNKQKPPLGSYPLNTNSLLRRRIQSAENIHHISSLQMLQVPEARLRMPWFPDLCEPGNSLSLSKQQSRRDNISGIGHVTASSVSLDYTADSSNSTSVAEKMLTMTKTSSLGKTMCVLPLRGMTTKTATQAQKHRHASTIENITTSQSFLIQDKNCNVSKSDSRLDVGQRCDEGNLAVRATPLILNSPDGLDSVVTLRHPTPKSASLPNDFHKQLNFNVSTRTPRKEVPSTADILQEQHRKGSLHPFRMSRMLFVISLVFVISFLPFFIIALMRSCMGLSFMALNEVQLGVLSVFIRSSLLSNAVNPVAYGFLSTHFRRECTGIMCCVFRR
ncbi:unnamed protein product [Candidula unifasciata]|uniref:G-protein coupled receptors family 1 profile domain-containing protein n=1 Tax=Candidula unifasciata TaxID=100452 RepID=A0A8S3ZNZ1_9EUPU|nr:unnamed protein product [Candidula unifasciata]